MTVLTVERRDRRLMSSHDPAKAQAARLAASLVQSDMVVGLGTGSTAAIFIEILGERIRDEGLRIQAVPTSDASARLATEWSIPLLELDQIARLDLTVDGADEVDASFRMVKGRGGALLREKLVARSTRRCVYIVGRDKLVDRLGTKCPLPVEVAPYGVRHTIERIEALGAKVSRRPCMDGFAKSDGGNALLDCDFGPVADPDALERSLKLTLGVFETGFFLTECAAVIVGDQDGAELIER